MAPCGWLLALLTLEASAGYAIPGTGIIQSMVSGLTPDDFGNKNFTVGGLIIPTIDLGKQEGFNVTNLNLRQPLVENAKLRGTQFENIDVSRALVKDLTLEHPAASQVEVQDLGVHNVDLDGSADMKAIKVRELDVNGSASLISLNMDRMRLGHFELGSLDLGTELSEILLLVKLLLICSLLIGVLLSARLCIGLCRDVICCGKEGASSRKKEFAAEEGRV